MSTHGNDARTSGHLPEEPESLDQLRGDCARMSSRWPRRPADADAPEGARTGGRTERPRGLDVPERSARLLDGMSDYGD